MDKREFTKISEMFADSKSKIKALSETKELSLIKKVKETNDQQAKELLILENLGLVYSVIIKIAGGQKDVDDYVQEGIIALEKAIYNFNCTKNVKFSTYAHAYIEYHLKKFILNQNKYSRLTKKEKKNLDIWIDAKNHFLNKGVISVSESELEEYLKDFGLNLKDIRQIEYKFYSIFPKETEITEYESKNSLDVNEILIKDELVAQSNNELLNIAISKLTPTEQDVVNKKFGLNGENPHTLQEIADIYKLSRERIRQIKAAALFKIETYIVNKF